MNKIAIDVVLDLSRGDCGKGKVSHALVEEKLSGEAYTHTLRFNGGGNAGHTIYHNGKKFVTHQIPSGVFYGIKSVIGPGCVINVAKLREEIVYLESNGVSNVRNLLKIANNAHIIQEDHLIEDGKDTTIGTTKTGNGPCYRDKYARKGIRAIDVLNKDPLFQSMLIDMFQEFYNGSDKIILAEGAQGFYLDIDWGAYPYVTSSHCGIGAVLLNGFSHKHIRNVYGVAKAYETYVGLMKFEPANTPVLTKIREIGKEFGATTGRPRQCNWLNLSELIKAAQANGVSQVIINKIDVLDAVQTWNLFFNDYFFSFATRKEFMSFINASVRKICPETEVIFSDNPYDISTQNTNKNSEITSVQNA